MTSDWNKEFPAILSSHRERTKLTEAELATTIDVPVESVTSWESGEALPSLPEYFSLAEVFGWPIPRAFVRQGLAGN